jgi:lipopolysaccharide biosynthesis glycosyltransferase
MDLARWRAEGYAEAILRFLVEHQADVQFGDQDGINAVMAGNWGELDPLWNVQVFVGVNRLLRLYEDVSLNQQLLRDRRRLLRDAFIWHFAGPWKPWARGCFSAGQLEWLRTLRQSGWFQRHDFESRRTVLRIYGNWLIEKIHSGAHDAIRRPSLP